jgi:type VI secretion system secreted protein VgrG
MDDTLKPEMPETRQNNELALLHFEAIKNVNVMVTDFVVEEAVSHPFVATVDFLANDPRLDFDSIVGTGAAFSVYTSFVGERVWAGICSELELVNSEEHTAGNKYKGYSRYRIRIHAPLWRLSLRRNSRIFQHMKIPEIVKKILGEWEIEVNDKGLLDTYPPLEFKVQYQETDFAFVSRLLEEAGITYRYIPADKLPKEETPGAKLTELVLEDTPFDKKPTYPRPAPGEDEDSKSNALDYLGDRPNPGEFDYRPQMWGLKAIQRPQPLSVMVRDRNFRGRMDKNPQSPSQWTVELPKGGTTKEEKYEQFFYQPGVFWTENPKNQADPPGPLADVGGHKNRVDQEQLDAGKDKGLSVAERRRDALFFERMHIQFSTNALDLLPGCIFQIGEDGPFAKKHPHHAFDPSRRLMVVSRTITGRGTTSTYTCNCLAVFASPAQEGGKWPRYRPALRTPKPRIAGVQSAVVVGPKDKEIYTDEFGRVRVQFPWDREHDYDDKASCWIRVSQAWAGGGFGFIAIPRVGHEVLVGFFEGDPDQPIIVGRVYNQTTKPPYWPVTGRDALGDNWTKTGIRTDTSPHKKEKKGYNELVFQDQRDKELIHIQAQRDLSIIVKAAESHNCGSTYTILVGGNGKDKGTSFTMTPTAIELLAPGCSLVVGMSQSHGSGIHIEAKNTIHVHSGGNVLMTAVGPIDVDTGDIMTIDTGKELYLNCGQANAPDVTINPATPAAAGQLQGPPFLPSGPEKKPEAPGTFADVMVAQETEISTDTDLSLPKVGDSQTPLEEAPLRTAPNAPSVPNVPQLPNLENVSGAQLPNVPGAPGALPTASNSPFAKIQSAVKDVKQKVDQIQKSPLVEKAKQAAAIAQQATKLSQAIKKGDALAASQAATNLTNLPGMKKVAEAVHAGEALSDINNLARAATFASQAENALKQGGVVNDLMAASDLAKAVDQLGEVFPVKQPVVSTVGNTLKEASEIVDKAKDIAKLAKKLPF